MDKQHIYLQNSLCNMTFGSSLESGSCTNKNYKNRGLVLTEIPH